MIEIFLIFILVPWVSPVVYVKAPCPTVKAMENFNMDKYNQGQWYEVARYPNDVQKRGDCTSMRTHDEKGRSYFNITDIRDGKLKSTLGYYLHAPNTSTSGLLYVHSTEFKDDEVNNVFLVNILKTDYDNYAIGFECNYNEETKTRHDFLWIQSRTKKLSNSSKAAIDEFFDSVDYVDRNKLIWDHFTDESCKIKP